MMTQSDISGYAYSNSELSLIHDDLLAPVERLVNQQIADKPKKLFDLGCGNGAIAAHFLTQGFDVTGIDPSPTGIQSGRNQHPQLKIYQGSAYDNLAGQYGQFPIVISLEVVEHVYSPQLYAETLYNLVETGGVAIVSTPYHSYVKNLALAVTGKMDDHFTALWEHGHIKFWSTKTLTTLLEQAGFHSIQFKRVGRIPAVAKSMIAIAHK